MGNSWYGWIPILTHELSPEDIIPGVFPRQNSDSDDFEEINGEKSYSANGFIGFIKIFIPEIAEVEVVCDIRSTGLVRFTFNKVAFSSDPDDNKLFNEKFLPNQIFDILRAFYHEHVHHCRKADSTLFPVFAEEDIDAIRKILNQYRKKIIKYNKAIADISQKKVMGASTTQENDGLKEHVDLLNTAKGEFIYAASFLNLHKDLFEKTGIDFNHVERFFGRSSESVSVLKDKSSFELMHRSTVELSDLTKGLFWLTVVLVISIEDIRSVIVRTVATLLVWFSDWFFLIR